MANNYTAVANRLSGIPGRTAGSDDITVTINPLADFRVFVEDFSINDPQGLFDSVTKIQSGQSVIFTLSLRSDVVFQATDSVLDIDIVGNAVSADEGDDIVIIGDIVIPDGNDDLDIIVTDEDGDPIGDNIIHIDVLGDMPGDEIIIGMLEINPKEGDEFPDGTEDIDIDDLFDWPKDEFGNDLYILRGPISDSDGGGFIYEIVIVVPNEDDMNLGDGMPVGIETVVILLDGSGNPIDQTINPITEIVEVPEITDININSDNIDPTGGGFVVITAQGDPGATGTVTITPTVTGSLPDGVMLEVITVDIVIDENGLFVETVRIPSAVGEQNVDPICRPVLPDDFEGIEWTVVAESDAVDEDGMPIVETDVMDPITQDEGTTICIEVSSLDPTVEIPETIVLGPIPRGFTFPPGNGRFSIPAALGNQWTIINNDITPFISRTGPDTGITICNSRVDSTFDPLDIDFQYTSGTARGSKTTYNIDLDSIATLNTEVAIEFRIPDAFNFAFDLDSPASGRFAYAGVPNTAVPALDVAAPANAPTYGGIPAYIDIRVDDPNGFTWEESDIMINSFTTITEDAPHITIDRIILPNGNAFNPQSVGNIPVLRVIWTVTGNFPTPVLGDIVDETILEFTEDATPITGVTFDLGIGNRGHATLIDSSFNNILPLTGPEGRAWTTRYAIQPDPGHVITNASIDVNSENIHNSADLDAATGVTISAPTLQSGELSGSLAGNFFSENYTVQPDFDADALAMGTARFTLDATGVSNSTSVLSPTESFPLIEGESVSATATIDSPITHGFLLSDRPTATVAGVDTMFMSRNPRVFNGETYYDWTLTTSHTFGDTPGQDVVIPITASGTPVQLPVIYTIPVDITIDGFSHITVVGDGVTVDLNGDLVIVGDVPSTLNGVEITLHSLNGWGIDNVDDVDVNFGLVGSVTQTGVVLNGLPDNSVVDLDDNTITYTVNIVLPNNPGEEITDQTTVTQGAAATGLRPLVMLDVFLDEAATMPLTERPVVRNFPATGGTETLYVRAIGQGLGTGWRTRRGIAGYQVSAGTQLDGVSPLVITNSATNTSPTVETVEILEIESRALSDVFIPFRLVQNVAPLILDVDTTEITFGPEVGSTNSFTFTTNDNWIVTGLELDKFTADVPLTGDPGTHTITFTTVGPYVNANIFDDLIISTTTEETSEGNAIVPLQHGVRLLQSNIVLMLRERGTTNIIDETIVFDSSTTSMPFDVFVNSFGVGAGGWTSSVSDFTITPPTGGEGTTPIGIAPISANPSITDQVTGTATFTSVSSTGVTPTLNLIQEAAPVMATSEGNPFQTSVTTTVGPSGTGTLTFTVNDSWMISGLDLTKFTTTDSLTGLPGTHTITFTNVSDSFEVVSDPITFTTTTQGVVPFTETVTIMQPASTRTFSFGGDNVGDGTFETTPSNAAATGLSIPVISSNDPSLTWRAIVSTNPDNFITLSSTTGALGVELTYDILANSNPGNPVRSGIITLDYLAGDGITVLQSVMIRVNQAAAPAETLTLSSGSGLVAISAGNAVVTWPQEIRPIGSVNTVVLNVNSNNWSGTLSRNGVSIGDSGIITLSPTQTVTFSTSRNDPSNTENGIITLRLSGDNNTFNDFEELGVTTTTRQGSVIRQIGLVQTGDVRTYEIAFVAGSIGAGTFPIYSRSVPNTASRTNDSPGTQRLIIRSSDTALTWTASLDNTAMSLINQVGTDGTTPQDYSVARSVAGIGSSTEDATFRYTWNANAVGADARIGVITFTYSNGETATFTVTQAAGLAAAGTIFPFNNSAEGNRPGTIVGPTNDDSGIFQVINNNAPWIIEAPEGYEFSSQADMVTRLTSVMGNVGGIPFAYRVYPTEFVGEDTQFTLELRVRNDDGSAGALIATRVFTQEAVEAPEINQRIVVSGPVNRAPIGSTDRNLGRFTFNSSEAVTVTSSGNDVYLSNGAPNVGTGRFPTESTTLTHGGGNNVTVYVLPILDNSGRTASSIEGTITVTTTSGVSSTIEYFIVANVTALAVTPGDAAFLGASIDQDSRGNSDDNYFHPVRLSGSTPSLVSGISTAGGPVSPGIPPGQVNNGTITGVRHGSTPETGEYTGEDADWHLAINESLDFSLRNQFAQQWQIHAYRRLATPTADGEVYFREGTVVVVWVNNPALPDGGVGGLNISRLVRKGSFSNLGASENYKIGNTRQDGDPTRQRVHTSAASDSRTVYSHQYSTTQSNPGSRGVEIPTNLRVNGTLLATYRFQLSSDSNTFVDKNIYYYDEASIRAAKGR